jgi:hypothetical protein
MIKDVTLNHCWFRLRLANYVKLEKGRLKLSDPDHCN